MAEKKNFTIENYNGTDYDTLYPETNSGQVLLDTTAQAATNLPSGATLNDALNKLNKFDNRYEIGDVLTTSRTNLSNKWLLCNGAAVNSSDYPELATMFDSSGFQFNQITSKSITSHEYKNYSIAAKSLGASSDGILISILDVTQSQNRNASSTFYWKDTGSSGDWVAVTGGRQTSTYGNNLYYLNNNFISMPSSGGLEYKKYVYYCSGNPATDGFKTLPTLSADVGVSNGGFWKDVVYCNNKYYFFLYNANGRAFFYVYDNLSSNPTKVTLDLYQFGDVPLSPSTTLSVVDGKVCLFVNWYSSSTYHDLYIYSIDASNTITSQKISSSTLLALRYQANHTIYNFGGKYVDIVEVNTNSFSVYQCSTLTGNYTKVTDFTPTSFTGEYKKPWLVTDDKIFLCNKKYIDTSMTVHDWSNSSSISNNCMSFSQTDKNVYTICPQYQIWGTNEQPQFNLPTYSPATGLRAYIKAKN